MPRAAAGGAGAKKGRAPKTHKLPEKFPPGEVLHQTQGAKKRWQLGEIIGQGGFGLIYKGSDVTEGPSKGEPSYVVKIEPLDNGPLFCEFHFYQRAAKPDSIVDWAKLKKLRYLGVPALMGYGQHKKGDKQYRFLVLQRLSTDLQKTFEQNGRAFSEKTAFSIGLRMLDALEYIHDKGYCHADIKAANILLGYNNNKTDFNQVYLVDYGLAYRYLVDGAHKPYKEDPKRAHDGTAEYASRDAHKGVTPSRRGDLEILGYCLLEWLAGTLPWSKDVENKDRVRDLKIKYMSDLPGLYKACFGSKGCPESLKKYLGVVSKLAYDEKPDYNQLRQFLRSGASNEWTLGLTDTASPKKGVKRKSDGAAPSGAKAIKVRPSSSPARPGTPSGSRSRVDGSRVKSALTNGSSKATPPASKSRANGRAAAKVKTASLSPVGSDKIPGAKPSKGRPAKVAAAGSKTSAAGDAGRKRTPVKEAAVVSPRSRPSSATAGKERTPPRPVKRKRNKTTVSSDMAVQTSPGFGLRHSNNS